MGETGEPERRLAIRSLAIYFVILIVLCAGFVIGAKMLGKRGMYLAQGYMLTPAMAALLTRSFFYQPRFRDANLRFGRIRDYLRFWLLSICITVLSYGWFTALGGITWDFTGQSFIDRFTRQLAEAGQDITATLPPGFTPRMMLLLFFAGGLTIFNIMPGIITGFGEEFGHRGFMFPLLYRVHPWAGIVAGGMIWYAWHMPIVLLYPQAAPSPRWEAVGNIVVLGVGSICTFTYLAYVYVRTRSVWVTSVAHITLNNSAAAFSYFVVMKSQLRANLGLTVTMVIVVAVLYYLKELRVFAEYFAPTLDGQPAGALR